MHPQVPCTLPLLLAPAPCTDPERTPWGGRRIVERYGRTVPRDVPDDAPVGESWELSVTPDFPSRLDDGRLLSEVLASDPAQLLGAEAARGGTALLVKLLDAAQALSVQIHPRDDYSGLGDAESGKPESWYVLDRAPGAGLYLGLRRGVDEGSLRAAITAGADASALLSFVPVEPGDFFVIDAGTAHAIGPGVTLVEPQRVVPGRRGVTYRYWDWNRRYDAAGRPVDADAPDGRARTLHLEHALAVTDWDAPREAALLASARCAAGAPRPSGP
ncbi:MAG: class I mannose-6-phosphate isomerase, partial [Myxococcales bacterium]|nr:class I mannose-6-phosphate isomerase [Myxococcales bacterium]